MRRPSHVVARHRGRNKEDLCHCTSRERAQKPSDFSHSTLRCLPRRPKSGIFRHTFESTKWPNGPLDPSEPLLTCCASRKVTSHISFGALFMLESKSLVFFASCARSASIWKLFEAKRLGPCPSAALSAVQPGSKAVEVRLERAGRAIYGSSSPRLALSSITFM